MNQVKISENLILLVSIVVGGIGISFLDAVYSLLYFVFVAMMHLFVLRKVVCTNCSHYDSSCHLGWNKISSRLFGRGKEEKFEWKMKWVGVPVWIITFLLPVAGIVIFLAGSFSLTGSFILVLYLILVTGGLIMLGKFGCSECGMRGRCLVGKICPLAEESLQGS